MSKSIWNISAALLQLEEQLYESGGELTPELETALQITKEELSSKAESYFSIIRKSEGEAEMIEAEIIRLQALKKSKQNMAIRLRNILKSAMEFYSIKSVQTPLAVISLRLSESVDVEDVNKLPEQFRRTKVTMEANKIKIREALKSGEKIDGATLKTNYNLQIK